jgi:hypothetical protein
VKTFLISLVLCCIIGLSTSSVAVAVAGEAWINYYTDKSHTKYYYDSKSVLQPSKNIARVWSKYIISKEAKDAFPTSPNEVKSYVEFDCSKKTGNIIERYKDGVADKITSNSRVISYGSPSEILFNKICSNLKDTPAKQDKDDIAPTTTHNEIDSEKTKEASSAEFDGFRGLKWGSSPTSDMTNYHNSESGNHYSRNSDKLFVGACELRRINYTYTQGKLYKVWLIYPNYSHQCIMDILTTELGEPQEIRNERGVISRGPQYYWTTAKTRIQVECNYTELMNGQSGLILTDRNYFKAKAKSGARDFQ